MIATTARRQSESGREERSAADGRQATRSASGTGVRGERRHVARALRRSEEERRRQNTERSEAREGEKRTEE